MFMGERFPSFFFLTCHGKDILELKQAMFNLATSFHMKSRGPSGWKKKMKQKKNGSIEGEKKFTQGVHLNSWYFRKYMRMKIQHQQFLRYKSLSGIFKFEPSSNAIWKSFCPILIIEYALKSWDPAEFKQICLIWCAPTRHKIGSKLLTPIFWPFCVQNARKKTMTYFVEFYGTSAFQRTFDVKNRAKTRFCTIF